MLPTYKSSFFRCRKSRGNFGYLRGRKLRLFHAEGGREKSKYRNNFVLCTVAGNGVCDLHNVRVLLLAVKNVVKRWQRKEKRIDDNEKKKTASKKSDYANFRGDIF